MTNAALQLDKDDAQVIARGPILVFLLVAAADGTIDKKEVKQFQKLLMNKDYQVLVAMMQMADMPVSESLQQLAASKVNYVEELKNISAALDRNLPGDAARGIKAVLLALGKQIAESSGGFLGMFGSKISREEQAALAVMATAFGLLEGAPSVDQDTPDHALNSVPDDLYPLLKPADWAESARGHVLMQSVYGTDEIKPGEPVYAYVIDSDSNVSFVNRDELSDKVTQDVLHQAAFENLHARLAQQGVWEELNFDLGPEHGTVEGLLFTGDFYCAEAMLSETLLKQAHEKLNSAFLMLAAPERGRCFVTALENLDQPAPLKLGFMQAAIKGYFKPQHAPISPMIWLVRNGKLVGHAEGMEGAIQSVREAAENELAEEDRKLTCLEKRDGDAGHYSLTLDVTAQDIEVMLKNLQFHIRDSAQQHGKQDNFSGNIAVNLNIKDPAYSPSSESELRKVMDDMFAFLSGQIQDFFDMGALEKQISLSYKIVK